MRRFLGCVVLCVIVTAELPGQVVASGKVLPNEVIPLRWIVTVFRPDGTLQCQPGTGIPLEVMAKELTSNGARVLDMRKVQLPMAMITQCDAPTGMVNRFTIEVAGRTTINRDSSAATAFRYWPAEVKSLMVSVRDGAERCGARGVPIEVTAKRLTDAGVTPEQQLIIPAGPDPDRAGRCGVPIGDTHVFLIPAGQLLSAKRLKFREMASRLPSQCTGVTAPLRSSPDTLRVSQPESRIMIIPDVQNRPPANLRGKPIMVHFYLDSRGAQDSMRFEPSLSGGFARSLTTAMDGYKFAPAVFDGCFVAARYSISLTF